jgi:glucans biosynthesis protein
LYLARPPVPADEIAIERADCFKENRMLVRPLTSPDLRYRRLLVAAALLLAIAAWPARSALATFGLDDVAAQAQKLAQEPFRAAKDQVPEWMLKMNYDQWRDIRFRPDHALWHDQHLPFQVQFFHPGLYYDRTIAMNVIDAHGVHHVPFSPNNFDYGKNDFASKIPQDIGYAGFRIHAPIKTPKYYDEVIVFLGASYFRSLGKHEIFGASARGLAIDTAESSGEEFPYFTEYWLVSLRPAPNRSQCMHCSIVRASPAPIASSFRLASRRRST